jgi:hypothetical protein
MRHELPLPTAMTGPLSIHETKQSDSVVFLNVVLFSAIGLLLSLIAIGCDAQSVWFQPWRTEGGVAIKGCM